MSDFSSTIVIFLAIFVCHNLTSLRMLCFSSQSHMQTSAQGACETRVTSDHDSSQDRAEFYAQGRNTPMRHEPCPHRTFTLLEKITTHSKCFWPKLKVTSATQGATRRTEANTDHQYVTSPWVWPRQSIPGVRAEERLALIQNAGSEQLV